MIIARCQNVTSSKRFVLSRPVTNVRRVGYVHPCLDLTNTYSRVGAAVAGAKPLVLRQTKEGSHGGAERHWMYLSRARAAREQ